MNSEGNWNLSSIHMDQGAPARRLWIFWKILKQANSWKSVFTIWKISEYCFHWCNEVFRDFHPLEVFVHHHDDVHSDHRIIFDVVASCTKWFLYPSIKRVLALKIIQGMSSSLIPVFDDNRVVKNYLTWLTLDNSWKLTSKNCTPRKTCTFSKSWNIMVPQEACRFWKEPSRNFCHGLTKISKR